MNKYQKIALAVGAIVLLLLFGSTVTRVGLMAIRSLFSLMKYFVLVVVAIALVIVFLKKVVKTK